MVFLFLSIPYSFMLSKILPMNLRKLLFLILSATLTISNAQDLSYAKKIVDTLASPTMKGRGYVDNGLKIAAKYIENEFRESKLSPIKGSDFAQKLNYSINTFPGKMLVKIDGKELVPGKDYVVDPSSGGGKGTYDLIFINKQTFEVPDKERKFYGSNLTKMAVVVDKLGIEAKVDKQKFESFSQNPFGAKAIIQITDDKFTWSLSEDAHPNPVILINRKSIPTSAREITFDIDQKIAKNFSTSNIIGYSKGSQFPDSFIVFTAHYDHLGMMGENTYFPGANDNASGVAMLLNLAKYYGDTAAHRTPYSMVFIAFTGEEAGLSGSKYYVQNPLFPLSKIKFLLNMDLLGTGEDGITVVNGTIYEDEFELLEKLSEAKNYLPQVKKRGKAANSDHHPFTEKKVKSIFIYTMGGISAYHDIFDKASTLPLTKFDAIFKLIKEFVVEYTRPKEDLWRD